MDGMANHTRITLLSSHPVRHEELLIDVKQYNLIHPTMGEIYRLVIDYIKAPAPESKVQC